MGAFLSGISVEQRRVGILRKIKNVDQLVDRGVRDRPAGWLRIPSRLAVVLRPAVNQSFGPD